MFVEGLGERLRAARAAANFTQVYVAARLKCHSATLANWERGRAEPSATDLSRLATLYDVSADWLLTGSPLKHRFERPA